VDKNIKTESLYEEGVYIAAVPETDTGVRTRGGSGGWTGKSQKKCVRGVENFFVSESLLVANAVAF